MPTITVNGVGLYYDVHGQGEPILGIHGTPSSALLWEDAARELAAHGRCIIYDRRGFFRSERPEPFDTVDLADQVDDAAALLEGLSATPAVVIGRSTGGEIALALAQRHPGKVNALVLLEPAVFTIDPEAAAWAQALRGKVLETVSVDPSRASEVLFREALGDEAWESFPAELRDHFSSLGHALMAEIRGVGLDLSERPMVLTDEELAGIGQPTLIVSAEDSPAHLHRVNERLARALPDAETELVTGGHLIHPAHPAVLDFIDRNVGSRATST